MYLYVLPRPGHGDWLDRIASSKGAHFAALLRRISGHMNGEHNLDEIIWRENISRADLLTVLDKLRNDIVTVLHPARE